MRKVDIKKVMTALGATTFKDSGDSVMTNCPLARWDHESGKDSRPSFGVKEDQGMSVAHCFTCGFKGGMLTLIRRYGNYAIPENLMSKEDLKQLIDFVIISEDEEVETVPVDIELPKPSDSILKAIGVWHDYFTGRGITKESFDMWELGFYDMDDRIVFPVFQGMYGKEKDPVGVVGRAIHKDNPVKYSNYPARFKKSWFLYGLWLKHDQNSLIVVEGPIDAVKVNQKLIETGYDKDFWCVALLGSEPSKVQMDLLVDNADEVICMLDNDASGKKGLKDLYQALHRRVKISVVEYPENVNDPDEADSILIDMIDKRLTALEWQVNLILDRGGERI